MVKTNALRFADGTSVIHDEQFIFFFAALALLF
jgi:hypothetical protein